MVADLSISMHLWSWALEPGKDGKLGGKRCAQLVTPAVGLARRWWMLVVGTPCKYLLLAAQVLLSGSSRMTQILKILLLVALKERNQKCFVPEDLIFNADYFTND